MKPSPCLNPRRIYNATLGRFMHVPCGKCDACLVNKGRARVDRIDDVFLKYKYRYFFTLTYANWYLPVARYDEIVDAYVSPRDSDYNGVVYSVPIHKIKEWHNEDFVKKLHYKFGGIPVLCHRDIILFQKRLRKELFKLNGSYEKIFLHHCGEYGPTGYRPHVHCLFGTNTPITERVFERCVHTAWSLPYKTKSGVVSRLIGKIDVQRNYDNGSTKYVAQYLNCTTHLPFVLSRSVFKPFCSRTFYPVSRYSRREFFNGLPKSYTVCRTNGGKFDTLPVTSSRYAFVFPKYGGYLRLSCYDRVKLFRFSLRFLTATSGRVAALKFLEVYKVYMRFRVMYFDNTDSFVRNDLPELDAINILRQLYKIDTEDALNRLTNFFQVNRKIYQIINELNVTPLEYFQRFDLYHSELQLYKLETFYNELEQLSSDALYPLTLPQLRSYYIHTDTDCSQPVMNQYNEQFGLSDTQDVEFPPGQYNYASLSHKILLDTTKTKKRNDDFDKRGIRRKKWIPFISKRINSFLQT